VTERMARWGIRLGWVLLVAPFVFEGVGILRANDAWLIVRTPDDAFYYLEIARRIGAGQGLTFDGVHATNGFHPLWQFLLAGVGLLIPGQTAFLRVSLLLGLACLLAATLLVVRLVWRWLGPGPALLGGILVAHGRAAMPSFVDGMEGTLALLALAGLATAMVWWASKPEPVRAVLVGVLAAVAVLARLDLVVVLWIVPLAMVARTRRWRWFGWWSIGAAVAAPWFVWFWVRYHHLLTTSATVKQHELGALAARHYGGRLTSGYAHYVWRTGNAYVRQLTASANASLLPHDGLAGWFSGLVVTALALLGLWVFVRRRRRDEPLPLSVPSESPGTDAATGVGWALATMAVVLVAKAVFDLVNLPVWAQTWYSIPQRFALTFAAGAVAWLGVAWLVERSRRVGAVVVVLVVLIALPMNMGTARDSATYPRFDFAWQDAIDSAATWIRDHGPVGRYGARDAGLLGYRLDGRRDVVNLDGLVNDYSFADRLARGQSLRELIVASGVDYYVNRINAHDRAELSCGKVLWTSPGRIDNADGPGGTTTSAPVYVLDVRGCGAQ
jgi:hypothetical protein